MTIEYISILSFGTIKDPILWIISAIVASNIISKTFYIKLFYLILTGCMLGFIRLYVYKSFGESLSILQSYTLVFICILAMILFGLLFMTIFKLFKSKS